MTNPLDDERELQPLHVRAGIDLSSTDDNAYRSYPGYAELVAELVALLQAGDHMGAYGRQGAWYRSLGIVVFDGRHPIDDALELAGEIPPWRLDLSLFKLPDGWAPPVDPDA